MNRFSHLSDLEASNPSRYYNLQQNQLVAHFSCHVGLMSHHRGDPLGLRPVDSRSLSEGNSYKKY